MVLTFGYDLQISDNRITILILDDDPDIVSTLEQGLRRGFWVSASTDPNLALEHFESNYRAYDLVISDIRMPQMNGFEFIKKVKEVKPTVKVFFMTAFEIPDIEFSNQFPSIIVDKFIQKPVTIAELERLILTHIPKKVHGKVKSTHVVKSSKLYPITRSA